MFDSDFNIRLATLAALGGDTSVTFDSVYSIDIEILKLTQGGGGGGMDYNAIKAALAASGVTEILFNDGDSSVTLDYAKVMQIGKGGNITVETVDELSGITNPTDGMFAYITSHNATADTLVLTLDEKKSDWVDLVFSYPASGNITMYINQKGHSVYTYGRWYDSAGTDITDWLNLDNYKDQLPLYAKKDGTTVALTACEEGAEYETEGEYRNTYEFYPYNGALPTIQLNSLSAGDLIFSSITSGETSYYVPAIGLYRYYADIDKWLPYEIYWDELEAAQMTSILNDFYNYNKPLFAWRTVDSYGKSIRRFDTAKNNSNGVIFYTSTARKPSADVSFYQFSYQWSDDENRWNGGSIGDTNLVQESQFDRRINEAVRIPYGNPTNVFSDGEMYAVPINDYVSGTIYSASVTSLDSDVWDENCIRFRNSWSGAEAWIDIRPDGHIRVKLGNNITFNTSVSGPSLNEDWWILDYRWQSGANYDEGAWAMVAVRAYEAGVNSFNVELFVSTTAESYQDMYSVDINSSKSYTWNTTTNQSVEVQPTLYVTGRLGNDDGLGRTLIKLVGN